MQRRVTYIAWLLLCLAAEAQSAGTCARYGEEGVVLKGRVVLRTFYGPPNYGENPKTDAREKQALLKLDQPLCTVESADVEEQAEHDQREVTLVPFGKLSLAPYAGKHVSVQGSLFHSSTGHHHTPILIELRQPPVAEP